ncbi:beta-N-acetylhexosaminidase [Jeongeupia sp. HS-3]|uniref:family 20 glycosylhydrolase n=1 Tax=Jeongeupia sp. HS-3 TaxID=1009682 RepID=UPI0018A3D35E|nr:family 20 glycosylhydrolase [Jeongeupia sp. HS-3]BCL75985.1 beta-N-acetylhexosaminidase [Jeongeupia sp. HS-3]
MSTPYPAASHLALSWTCICNSHDGDNYRAELQIRNLSHLPLPESGWGLYFNTCRQINPERVSAGVCITHENGDLWRLSPTAEFGVLAPGETRVIGYEGPFWLISDTDAPLGFYMVYDEGAGGERVEDIGDPDIAPFLSDAQRNRNHLDRVPLGTPLLTYENNAGLTQLPVEQVGKITPTPLQARYSDGHFALTKDTLIVHEPALAQEAALLRAIIAEVSGVQLQRASFCPPGCAAIQLRIAPLAVAEGAMADEAYELDIGSDGIRISGTSAAGVFNGIQSLRQLLPVEAFVNPRPALALPCCQIVDAPRFGYRGMMLDVGRHFSSKQTVLRLLECMALYKLNRFHFHLSDDEGWRLEIPSLPELVGAGSQRGHGHPDQLPPSFGSGAQADGSAGTGHYTRQDFIDILRYATARHIEVIPEFTTPGHARAAIKAMQQRHARLMQQGREQEAMEYLLSDPDDASRHESVQLWHDNVICIGQESYYRFIETVLVDVKAMYVEAGARLTTVQTGGDEVPAGAWAHSPVCQAFMAEKGLPDVEALRVYALARYHDILKKHALAFAGWEETALLKNADTQRHRLNPDFIDAGLRPYAWNSSWGGGQEDMAYRLANAGYQTVLCNVSPLYFDLAYAKDPAEPGYYWGGFTETRDTFEFCPLDIFTTASTTNLGNPLDARDLAGKTRLSDAGRKHILGMQGHLWAENIRNRERLEYLALPRMIALAERAWASDPGWTFIADAAARQARMAADWNEFANRLGQRELPRLDGLSGGYGYRIPVPGAKIENGVLSANVSAPGLAIRFSTDGSEPDFKSTLYTGEVRVTGPVKLAAFSSTHRRSRTICVAGSDD